MPTRFFPYKDYEYILERKNIFMLEYKTYPPDSMMLHEFVWLSNKAHARREQRRKATLENKIFVD